MSDFITQHDWTPQELRESGFHKFNRKKRMVLARRLPDEEAPLKIRLEDGGLLVAEAGYMICYHPEGGAQPTLADYKHWPVEPNIFAETYEDWDDPWVPTPAQQHLLQSGCKAYFKAVGVWAKELEAPIYLQSLEHDKPVLVPEGTVVAIGPEGEPYHIDQDTFEDSYELPLHRRMLKRMVDFFKFGE